MKYTSWAYYARDTLALLPLATEGQWIRCPHCGGQHMLERAAEDVSGSQMLFYRCGGVTCVGAIQGRLITLLPPDASATNRRNIHAACDACWETNEGSRAPVRVSEPYVVPCCWCGEATLSGIYRFDKAMPPMCDGHHP